MKDRVEKALEEVRPWLRADGGDVDLIGVSDDGKVSVKLTGACHGCPMAQMTLHMGIKKRIMELVPEVTDVEAV